MKNAAIFIAVILLLAGAAYALVTLPDQDSSTSSEPVTTEAMAEQNVDTSVDTIDVEAALKDRILGDPSAPIRISEHSSFTCGHCGAFHKNTFPAFKQNYIDTGKAYLVFSDFPLNAPALHASMTARCIPDQARYFEFVDLLFAEQEDWAYETSYLTYLKRKASEFGLSGEGFEACLQSKELQEGILNRVKASQAQWDIKSTPSFVINNKTTLSGAMSFETFSKAIEDATGAQTEPESESPASGK